MAAQTKTTRLLNKLTPEHFRPADDDTRKLMHICKERRSVLLELRGYADSDGTNVEPAVATIAKSLGLSRRTVFRRFDDLKQLGLLIDEDRLGFDKPRRRHINLARAQELLGIARNPAGRPEGLPDCVPSELWSEFLEYFDFDEEMTKYLVAGLQHQFHMFTDRDDCETFVIELVKFSINTGIVPYDWQEYTLWNCRTEGCRACGWKMFYQEHEESDSDFDARWQREAISGDRVVSRSEWGGPGSVLTAEHTLEPLATRRAAQ